jgi:signal transduction histidine kinase
MMRTPRIGIGLIVFSAVLVTLVTWTITASAARVLRRIAEDEALAFAQRAAGRVGEGILREAEELATSARILSERPTLARILQRGTPAEAAAFLEDFRRGGQLDGCSVLRGEATWAFAGTGLPEEAAAHADSRVRIVLRVADDGRVTVVALESVAPHPGATVAVSRTLDPGAAGEGALVRAWSRRALEAASFGPRSPLRGTALDEGRTAAAKVEEEAALVAAAPLRSAGSIVGIVEAEVPVAQAVAAERAWVREVRRIALAVLVAAALGSVVFARALAAPLERLGRAATRIGLGDLETPVPPGPGGEVDTLARTMEEMRLRLLETSREIRRRQAESEAILAGMHEGVFGVDADRRVRYLNPHAARMLGVTASEAIGRFCGDVLRATGADGRRPCEDSCPILDARAGGPARALEHVGPAGRGRRTVVVTSAAPVEGQQIQLLRGETDVEAGRRLRDAVLANVTHEFRTPLAAQLASIEMLRDRLDSLSPGEARGLVLALERGALRLTRLVDNLLESVRLEAGELAIRRQPVALDDVLEEAVEAVRPLAEQRNQAIAMELPAALPRVVGDAPRLVQVFVNLLANANKYAPEATTIRVGGAIGPGGVTLWVEDEGPGLPEGDETVFERFVRRPGDEPEQSGLGLGLWIARSIVERHGGRLRAEPGQRGARLCVSLPGERVEDPGSG